MEAVVERGNLLAALRRVKQNKGSPGVDGMTVGDLSAYLRENWVATRERLLSGHYAAHAVRRVEIPKERGRGAGARHPDRARPVHPTSAPASPATVDPRSREQATAFGPVEAPTKPWWLRNLVGAASACGGRGPGEVLRPCQTRRVDGPVGEADEGCEGLGLIRRYLEAGVMLHGVVVERHEGTPQGGPYRRCWPTCSWTKWTRSWRSADTASSAMRMTAMSTWPRERAGMRVMALLRKLYGNLQLKVNESKSAVDLAVRRKILGYSMWHGPKGSVKLRVAPKAIQVMKEKVRQITGRNGGRSIQAVVEELRAYLPGWKNYFSLAETPGIFRALDEWIRHRLRQLHLKQWKRGKTIYRELMARGIPEWVARQIAANTRRWWRNSSKT